MIVGEDIIIKPRSLGYTQMISAYAGPMPEVNVWDDRYNPKAWAQWMREFLQEFLSAGERQRPCTLLAAPRRMIVEGRIRGGPLHREWKMKSWKQWFNQG